MSSTTDAQADSYLERTETSLEKYKERSAQLQSELGDARAATKVQIKAMIQRLDQKYEDYEARFSSLRRSSPDRNEIRALHDEIVSDLQTMVKTINRRIH